MANKDKKNQELKLLFFDTLDSNKPTYNIVEVFFNKAVNIQQFRILKPDSNPHANYKSMKSKTQKDIIYNFEIFGRNLKKIDDKFELIFKCDNINKTNGETDNIFPLLEKFTTNHVIFRGKFEMITMCIYGTTCDNNENVILMEQARTDVSLNDLRQSLEIKKNKKTEKSTLISKEEKNLLEKYPIEKLIGDELGDTFADGLGKDLEEDDIETENDEKFKEINYINKGNKEMIDKTKTGYIYYKNDLEQIIVNLSNFYNLDDKKISDQLILEHNINFKNLFIILEIIIDRNKAHLEDDCVFNEKNLEIFLLIPNKIISIINNSLKGLRYGETEIKFGLKLLKYISNFEKFVEDFIKNGGMEQLYNIILMNNEHQHIHSHGKKEIMPSVFLKALALENIYKLLTFSCAYEKLIEQIDKNNFPIKEFSIREIYKEKNNLDNLNRENEEDKDKRSRDRDRSRERESRHKRHSKSRTHSRSSSNSYSRHSRSRSRSHHRNGSQSSNHSKFHRREKRKNVALNNGLQILSTLIIGKNILLTNIMKNITKKINLIQYLKNFNDLINDYISSNFEKKYYLNRIKFYLHRIITLLQKLDTPFLHSSSPSNQNLISNKIDDDYPFKHFWIDYLDMNKKYFNKEILNEENNNTEKNVQINNQEEKYNEEYLIKNCYNKYNDKYENIIITNEISELLEQYSFFNNIIILLSCPNIQTTSNFYSLSLQIKEVLSLIMLNIGGINYLAKNHEKTSILLELIEKMITNIKPSFEDFCFKKIKIHNFLGNYGDKNDIINNKFSEILIPSQKIENIGDMNDLFLQINFLQVYYLMDYINQYIHLFDELENLLTSENSKSDGFYFKQKIYDILFKINKFYNKCELGKQGFLTLLNNKYFIQIFINLMEFINESSDEILDYEAHILLIIKTLYQIFISTDIHTSIFVILNKKIYSFLNKLNTNINSFLDKKESIAIDNNLINILSSLLSLLKILENTSITNLMKNLENNILSNILKYNLKEKKPEDQKLKRFYEEYPLLINKYNNDDINFLGDIYKNDSLINSIYLSIKLVDINFKLNPILLIEGQEGQLNSILKYLIINSVNSFNFLVKKQMYQFDDKNMDLELVNIILDEENNFNANSTANNNQLINKEPITISQENDNIIIIANFLYYLYDILTILLNNLLSSHVDNYRDEDIIEKLLSNISSCFNFLLSFYSLKGKEYKIGQYLYKKINAIQELFNKCLEVLHELCQFNTTIKLKFNDIIERILSSPENLLSKLFIVNFIFNNNNNEFTIDHFIDVFKNSPDKITANSLNNASLTGVNNNINFEETLMNEKLENLNFEEINLKTILSHCNQKINNFIDYIIMLGISTNDDFLKQQSAFILLSIFHKFTLKGNTDTFREIVSKIITEIHLQYESLSKVNYLYFEEKDYDIYLPKIRNLLNCVKFITLLISKDVKFLFIFNDVTVIYINIFKYAKNYILKTWEIIDINNPSKENNNKAKQLSNYVYDITLVILEGFKFLFDNKRNFEERFYFDNNIKYDLSEELPNSKQIKDILRELDDFLSVFKLITPVLLNHKAVKESDLSKNCNKVLFLVNKILEILLNLSTNLYCQNLLMDNFSLVKIISELKSLENIKNNKYFSLVIISLIKITLILFYDLDFYYLKSNKKKEDPIEKFIISEKRLLNLYKMFLASNPISENNSDKIIPKLYEYNNLLIKLIHNDNEVPALALMQYLQGILQDYKTTVDIIDLEKNEINLPKMRNIQEKFEFIHVYNYFKQIQGLGNECKLEINDSNKVTNANYSEIISTLNGTANSAINYSQKPLNYSNEYNNCLINEFEKLLNWKKARIYMNAYDSLKIRDINFNIDTYEFNLKEPLSEYEFKFYQLKKNYLYNTNDPFEQYCNSIDYDIYIVNQFKNLSAFVFDTICTKNYLFDSKEKHMNEIVELFFNESQNEPINLEEIHNLELEIKKYKNINESSSSSHKLKKKIKSKINKFIYKQKYDKQQNNNMAQMRLLMKQTDLQKFANKMPGRNLSIHVDNVIPEKKIVNIMYNNLNPVGINPNPNAAIVQNNSNLILNPNPSSQILVTDNTLPNIPPQNDPIAANYNMVNSQSNMINQINKTNSNLIPQQSDNRPNPNMNQINNLNTTTTPVNNMMNNLPISNPQNIPTNNLINMTPNQKNPISMNTIISNIKSPTNNNHQMQIMNTSPMNIPERKTGVNMNPIPGIPPNINPNPNLNINNPLNYGNIQNPNLIQNIPPNKNIFPTNNNVMNYMNPMPNPLMGNLNPIMPGTQGVTYPPIPNNQMNNIGLNPMNPNMPNNSNINNNQYGLKMNPAINPQMNQGTTQNIQNNITPMESGNLNNNNNNFNNRQQQKQNDTLLLKNIVSMLQDMNSNNSAAKDPRKNKKK